MDAGKSSPSSSFESKEPGQSPSEQKSVDSEIKLPEQYELLNEFFTGLDISIWLLQLRRDPAKFTNVRPQIESLTERRFTCSHLAQLKFIMPEAILLEIVRQRDEQTSNVKPDLLITLNFEVIESKSKSKYHSKNLQLRKLFHDRLLDFFKSHPEGDEVPKEALPEPFNQSGGDMGTTFSQRVAGHASVDSEDKFAAKSHSKLPLKPSGRQECSSYLGSSSHSIPSSSLPETPVKCTNSVRDEDQCSLLRTTTDLASTAAELMSSTPVLPTPKRCCMSPDDNSSRSPSKPLRRPPPNRCLKFDNHVKRVKVDDDLGRTENASADNDVFYSRPEALVQSIREKERLASIEQDPAISQAKWRRQMIAKLPKLFDRIYFFFQSMRCSVLPKKDLIEMILGRVDGQLDIMDRREIEEQLSLLQELSPEWIYEKSSMTGELLICVNKISSPAAIRTRLSKAK